MWFLGVHVLRKRHRRAALSTPGRTKMDPRFHKLLVSLFSCTNFIRMLIRILKNHWHPTEFYKRSIGQLEDTQWAVTKHPLDLLPLDEWARRFEDVQKYTSPQRRYPFLAHNNKFCADIHFLNIQNEYWSSATKTDRIQWGLIIYTIYWSHIHLLAVGSLTLGAKLCC